MAKLRLWSYDVWGNEEEGYQVNDRCNFSNIETDKKSLSEFTDTEIDEIISEYFGDPKEVTEDNGVYNETAVYLILNDKDVSDYPLGEIELEV